jgi:hypothetical protein
MRVPKSRSRRTRCQVQVSCTSALDRFAVEQPVESSSPTGGGVSIMDLDVLDLLLVVGSTPKHMIHGILHLADMYELQSLASILELPTRVSAS